jgi:hypothetical protein
MPDKSQEYLKYVNAAYQQYKASTTNPLPFDTWYAQRRSDLDRYFETLWAQKYAATAQPPAQAPQPQYTLTTQPPSASNPFQYATQEEIQKLVSAVKSIQTKYGVSQEQAAAILRGEMPIPGTNQYVPQGPAGVPPLQVKPGYEWEVLEEQKRATRQQEEFERARQLGILEGKPTLEAIKYANEVIANPQNAALAEAIRKGFALGPKPGETVAQFLNRTLEAGGIKQPPQLAAGGAVKVASRSDSNTKTYYGFKTPEEAMEFASIMQPVIEDYIRRTAQQGIGPGGKQALELDPDTATSIIGTALRSIARMQNLADVVAEVPFKAEGQSDEDYEKEVLNAVNKVGVTPLLEAYSLLTGRVVRNPDKVKNDTTLLRHIAETLSSARDVFDTYRILGQEEMPSVDPETLTKAMFSLRESEVPEDLSDKLEVLGQQRDWLSAFHRPIVPYSALGELRYRPAKVVDITQLYAVPQGKHGVVVGGEPHWIVDNEGNPVAAITEDGQPEMVKGAKHGVEVVPLLPERRVSYELKKGKDGGLSELLIRLAKEAKKFVSAGGNPSDYWQTVRVMGEQMTMASPPPRRMQGAQYGETFDLSRVLPDGNALFRNAFRLGKASRSAPSRRPGASALNTNRMLSGQRSLLPGNLVASVKERAQDMRAFNGLTNNGRNPSTFFLTGTDRDAQNILMPVRDERMRALLDRINRLRPAAQRIKQLIQQRGPVPVAVQRVDTGRIIPVASPGMVAVPFVPLASGGTVSLFDRLRKRQTQGTKGTRIPSGPVDIFGTAFGSYLKNWMDQNPGQKLNQSLINQLKGEYVDYVNARSLQQVLPKYFQVLSEVQSGKTPSIMASENYGPLSATKGLGVWTPVYGFTVGRNAYTGEYAVSPTPDLRKALEQRLTPNPSVVSGMINTLKAQQPQPLSDHAKALIAIDQVAKAKGISHEEAAKLLQSLPKKAHGGEIELKEVVGMANGGAIPKVLVDLAKGEREWVARGGDRSAYWGRLQAIARAAELAKQAIMLNTKPAKGMVARNVKEKMLGKLLDNIAGYLGMSPDVDAAQDLRQRLLNFSTTNQQAMYNADPITIIRDVLLKWQPESMRNPWEATAPARAYEEGGYLIIPGAKWGADGGSSRPTLYQMQKRAYSYTPPASLTTAQKQAFAGAGITAPTTYKPPTPTTPITTAQKQAFAGAGIPAPSPEAKALLAIASVAQKYGISPAQAAAMLNAPKAPPAPAPVAAPAPKVTVAPPPITVSKPTGGASSTVVPPAATSTPAPPTPTAAVTPVPRSWLEQFSPYISSRGGVRAAPDVAPLSVREQEFFTSPPRGPVVTSGAPQVEGELPAPVTEAPSEANLIASGGPRVLGPELATPRFGFSRRAQPWIAGRNVILQAPGIPDVFVKMPWKWTPSEILRMTPADRALLESYIRAIGQDPASFYAQLQATVPGTPTFRRFIG